MEAFVFFGFIFLLGFIVGITFTILLTRYAIMRRKKVPRFLSEMGIKLPQNG